MLLVVAAALAVAAERLQVPYPVLLVVGGLALAFVPGLPQVHLDPELVLLLFLPPLLFAAAWFTSWRDFARQPPADRPAGGRPGARHDHRGGRGWRTRSIPGMPWPVAFVLGAIVSPPDAVAATAVTQRLKVPRRIVTILEGESLVNDATGAGRLQLRAGRGDDRRLLAAARRRAVRCSWRRAASPSGSAVGWLVAQIHRRLEDFEARDGHHPADALRRVHPGRAPGRVGRAGHGHRRRLPGLAQPASCSSALTRFRGRGVWSVLLLLFNGLVFILIGLQLGDDLASCDRRLAGAPCSGRRRWSAWPPSLARLRLRADRHLPAPAAQPHAARARSRRRPGRRWR